MSRKSTKTKTKTIVDENIEKDVIPEETNVINNEQPVDKPANYTNRDTSGVVSEDTKETEIIDEKSIDKSANNTNYTVSEETNVSNEEPIDSENNTDQNTSDTDVVSEETNISNEEQPIDESTNNTNQDTSNSDTVSEDPTINSGEDPNQEQPPVTPTSFRIIEFSNNEESSIATIKNIITDSEGSTSKHIDEFKTKPTDIVKLYELNQEIINSETSAIETEISSINEQITSQNSTLTTLREEQKTTQTSYDEKQNQILEFEDSHKTVPEENPEGEPYFDANRLDSEASEEYSTLTSELDSINNELVRISGEITEAENLLNQYNSNLEAKQIQLNTLNETISPNSIDDLIPTKYLQEVEPNTEYATPDMFIEVIISGDNVPDFSDTEKNNKPYYYMVGTFTNKEVSGTTTKCLVLSSIDQFDELKTVNDLKTYYEFDKIFAISSTKKEEINSYRDTLSNNAITESGKIDLLNNSITYIPETEFSEITNLTDDTVVPSLTILVKTVTDEQPGGGEIEQPDTPVVDPEEETYDQYLRAGNIYIFNDIIFIIPNSSDSVKKIVFVNGYYYLLTTSCLIYKLDEEFKLVTTIDLTKISSDISKTNIFSAGNMLIIQSDKTYVTDAESIKNNYGILDTDVAIDSVKINTKTIVKILNK